MKLHGSSVEDLRIFILNDGFSNKFGLTHKDDYVFMDNLYVNGAGLSDVKKIANLVIKEFLDLDKIAQNYLDQLDNQRKMVWFILK